MFGKRGRRFVLLSSVSFGTTSGAKPQDVSSQDDGRKPEEDVARAAEKPTSKSADVVGADATEPSASSSSASSGAFAESPAVASSASGASSVWHDVAGGLLSGSAERDAHLTKAGLSPEKSAEFTAQLEKAIVSGALEEKKRIIDWIHANLLPRENVSMPYLGPPGPVNPLGLPYGLIPPVVVSHGISSSCYEVSAMHLIPFLRNYLNTYVTCVSVGGTTELEQYVASWFYGYKSSVDTWAGLIRSDPKLKNGFLGFGFSQGNGILRGYIQRYNNPPVLTWIATHGVLGGVGAIPGLDPLSAALRDIYRPLSNLVGILCTSAFLVNRITPCGYFRNPAQVNDTQFRRNSEIAKMNGEDDSSDIVPHPVKSNFNLTDKFVFVKGLEDNIILPRDAEWWAFYGDNYDTIYTMPHQPWYINNTFGLRTIVEAGKTFFRTTPRGHMQIKNSEMKVLLDDYVIPAEYRRKDWGPVPPSYDPTQGEIVGTGLNADIRYIDVGPGSGSIANDGLDASSEAVYM
ncbi:unnamed protein product [Amoebophrya sp. A25]|nr:unnamed protein product [Amoebophrya sp. A25]|eukprot:GSA25T00002034001.1